MIFYKLKMKDQIKKYILNFFLIFITFIFCFEIFSLIFTKLKLIPFIQEPTYSIHHTKGLGVAWRNEKMPWGAWHKINYEDFHKMGCFDVTYFSNDIGINLNIGHLNLACNAFNFKREDFIDLIKNIFY